MSVHRTLVFLVALAVFGGGAAVGSSQEKEANQAANRIEALQRELKQLVEQGKLDRAEQVKRQIAELKQSLAQSRPRANQAKASDIDQLRIHLREALHEAEQLQEQGKNDRADLARRRVQEIQQRLGAILEQRQEQERTRTGGAESLRGRLEALAREAEKLQEAGNQERAVAVRRQFEELHKAMATEQAQRQRAEGTAPRRAVQREGDGARREQLIRQVFSAVEALQALGRTEDAERLAAVGRELLGRRGEREREPGQERERDEHPEIQALRQQMAVMEYAVDALQQADNERLAGQLNRAIHAARMAVEGRRDQEANQIREAAPSPGNQIEILMFASRLLREQQRGERAAAVAQLAEAMSARFRNRETVEREEGARREREQGSERRVREGATERREGARREREQGAERRERERGAERRVREGAAERREGTRRERESGEGSERETARRHLEIMKLALPALREAGRNDTVEILQRSIRAREVALEGRRDDEAAQIREQAPPRAHDVEILRYASRLWREFGDAEKAETLDELAKQLAEGLRREPEKREGGERRRDGQQPPPQRRDRGGDQDK